MNQTFKSETLAGVYSEVLHEIMNSNDYESKPRDMSCYEILNATIVIQNPRLNLYDNAVRPSQNRYIAAELLWYFSATNASKHIVPHASFWSQIANADGTNNSAYGHLIFGQDSGDYHNEWTWAVETLKADKDSRQAVIHFNKPSHNVKSTKDYPCTVYAIFMIRDNRLHFTTHMRSNDAILGLPTDIAFFTILQQQMLENLRSSYPMLELGTYSHKVDSLHIYERHFDLTRRMLSERFSAMSITPVGQVNMITEKGLCSESAVPLIRQFYEHKNILASEHRDNLAPNSTQQWIIDKYEIKKNK